MKLPYPGFMYYMMRGSGPRRRAPAENMTGPTLVLCGVILATFYVLMFAARFVAIGAIATSLFWGGIGAVVASGVVGTARPWIGTALAVIVAVCAFAWPVSLIVLVESR